MISLSGAVVRVEKYTTVWGRTMSRSNTRMDETVTVEESREKI